MNPPRVFVESAVLREIFNRHIAPRIAAGELYARVQWERTPRPGSGQPPGTRSQIVNYYDAATDAKVAVVHRYLLPDGRVGASGLEDPKQVLWDGTVHVQRAG